MADAQEHLLLDLVSRGVRLFPSASAQLCSRSKVYQTALLGQFMVDGTRAIYSMNDMVEAVTDFGRMETERVVCKLDRANAGLGILCFSSIEDVYTQAVLKTLAFPFIIQPFMENCQDVRVVILGDTVEAYKRYNPHNFRHNLHCGGTSHPWDLTAEQLDFCLQVMERADFPHAHVDMLALSDGTVRLSEINLRGGLRGAKMNQQDYLQKVAEVQEETLQGWLASC